MNVRLCFCLLAVGCLVMIEFAPPGIVYDARKAV